MSKRYLMTAALLLATAAPLAAQQNEVRRDPRILSVTGTGTVQRQPDRAVVLVAVESRATTAKDAAAANARKMDAVYAALRAAGVVPPNVQTISYDLQPQYNQPDRNGGEYVPRITGYVANNMVRVQVDDVLRAGAIIDAAIAGGANRIANLSFELKDTESARLEALRAAVAKARAEAEVVAAAAGQRLGAPQNITSSAHWVPQPMYRRDMAMMEMAQAPAPPTPVEAGNLTITATVSINYLLEDL
jgi:uncharacterized protein YggE